LCLESFFKVEVKFLKSISPKRKARLKIMEVLRVARRSSINVRCSSSVATGKLR
jgi:hypothetical protein